MAEAETRSFGECRVHGQSEIDAARNGPLPSGKGLSSSSPEERGAVIDSDRWRFVRRATGQASRGKSITISRIRLLLLAEFMCFYFLQSCTSKSDA